MACDSQIDVAHADKGGNVGRWEEDEGDGVVDDEGDVQSVVSTELNVGSAVSRLALATLVRVSILAFG